MEPHLLSIVGSADLLHRAKDFPFPLFIVPGFGEIVEAEHDILSRRGQRGAIGRREDIVRRPQQNPSLQLCLERQRHMDRHLVSVEVGVEGGADEGMDLDGLSLHQHGLEGLDP